MLCIRDKSPLPPFYKGGLGGFLEFSLPPRGHPYNILFDSGYAELA